MTQYEEHARVHWLNGGDRRYIKGALMQNQRDMRERQSVAEPPSRPEVVPQRDEQVRTSESALAEQLART
jgi:hypothetical protein